MVNYWRLLRTWRRLSSFPHRDIEVIRSYQFSRFKEVLELAYHQVPMYRKLYEANGFHPSAVQQYEDIESVPILTKKFIRKFPVEERVVRGALSGRSHKETTTGSTGEPTEIWSDETESLIQALKGVKLLREWGYSVFDNVVQVWRGDAKLKRSLLQKLGMLRRDLISIMNEPDVKVARVTQSHCDVLMATRSSLQVLAEELNEREIHISPRILVSLGEMLTEEHRRLFLETYGCETLELYGCMETGNIAWGCPLEPRNLHVEMETVLVNYTNVHENSAGERVASLAVTNLENMIMPFIRFDPGDEVTLPKNDQCSCGRALQVLGRVNGRFDDIVKYRGRRFNSQFFYNYLKKYMYISQYKVMQTRSGDIEFRIRLHRDDEDTRKRCYEDLSAAFGAYFKPVNVRFVDKFPVPSTGKFKVIEKVNRAREIISP